MGLGLGKIRLPSFNAYMAPDAQPKALNATPKSVRNGHVWGPSSKITIRIKKYQSKQGTKLDSGLARPHNTIFLIVGTPQKR